MPPRTGKASNTGWTKHESGKFPGVWKPKRKGDTFTGEVVRVTQGKFGPVYRVKDSANKIWCLPSHQTLLGALEDAGVGAGDEVRVTVSKMGSREPGDYYTYDLETRGKVPF